MSPGQTNPSTSCCSTKHPSFQLVSLCSASHVIPCPKLFRKLIVRHSSCPRCPKCWSTAAAPDELPAPCINYTHPNAPQFRDPRDPMRRSLAQRDAHLGLCFLLSLQVPLKQMADTRLSYSLLSDITYQHSLD